MAAWDKKPNPLIKKRLYNLMADNEQILTKILNIKQKELNQLLKLYAKHPEKLYKALQYWIAQGTLLNNANIGDLATYINNMGTAYSIGLSLVEGTPIATQQAIKTVMQDSIMKYVTNVDTQTKQKLAKILTDGYDQKQMPRDTIKQMQSHLEHDKYRASMITHTETMRASNGASWAQAKAEGATHFIVDVRPGACKYCVKRFEGRVFGIDEVKYLPPLHPWCACVPQFFFSEDEAQNAADEFKQRNLDEIKRLKDKGFEFPENGTGPLSPEAIAQRKKGIRSKS